MPRLIAPLTALVLTFGGAASALEFQSSKVPGRGNPALCAPDGERIVINRADRTITTCNPDGSQSISTLLNALPAGRKAVEQGDSSDQAVKSQIGTDADAQARVLSEKLGKELISVLDKGASPSATGAQNAAAFTSAMGSGNRLVRIPGPGIYTLCPITVPPRTHIQQERGAILLPCSTTANAYTITAGSDAVLENITFDSLSSSGQTGGGFIDIPAGSPGVSVRWPKMSHGYDGIRISASNTRITFPHAYEFHNGRSVIEVLGGCANEIEQPWAFHDPARKPFANVLVSNSCDLAIYIPNLASAQHDVYLNPGDGQEIDSFKVYGGYLDSAGVAGLKAVTTGTGKIFRSKTVGTWLSGSAGDGAVFDTMDGGQIDGFTLSEVELLGNGGNGATVKGAGTKNISINSGQIAGNGSGIAVLSAASKVRVGGLTVIGPWGAFGPNAYPLYIDTGVGEVTIGPDVDLRGNTNGSVIANGAATRVRTSDTN